MRLILTILLSLLLVSCGAGVDEKRANEVDSVVSDSLLADSLVSDTSVVTLSRMKADSIRFRLTHHYTDNFNFCVESDSLQLIPLEGDAHKDTFMVVEGDLLVVAAIRVIPAQDADTVWVKVARDQYTMGWVMEDVLLANTVPDDHISKAIHCLSGSRGVWMSLIVVFGVVGFFLRRVRQRKLQVLQFDEMDSVYPFLFIINVALVASLYASVQNFVPEFWQEFYFNPTLNPFQLPPIMAALVVLVWTMVILAVAVLDEVYHHFYIVQALGYLVELLGLAMLVYLVVSWTTLYLVGYVLLPLLIFLVLWIYFRHVRCKYICGECGQPLRRKGVCANCGAENA